MNFCTGRWKRFWRSGRNFEVGKAGRYRVANHHDRDDDDAEFDIGARRRLAAAIASG
jgi:hypothetical protein